MLREASVVVSALLFAADVPPRQAPPADVRMVRRLRAAEEELASRLVDKLSKMPANWDGYGALPITQQTARNAKNLLVSMLPGIVPPDISPNPNGTLTFEWEAEGNEAHLEIGMNRFSCYLKFADGTFALADGDAANVPSDVKSFIANRLYPRLHTSNALTNLRLTAEYDPASF